MAKETDLLNDPLQVAQQRYQEQITAFKNQFIPKPTSKPVRDMLTSRGLRPEILLGRGDK